MAEREAEILAAGDDVTWLLTGIFRFEKEEEFSRNLSSTLSPSELTQVVALFELPISTRELFTLILRCKTHKSMRLFIGQI